MLLQYLDYTKELDKPLEISEEEIHYRCMRQHVYKEKRIAVRSPNTYTTESFRLESAGLNKEDEKRIINQIIKETPIIIHGETHVCEHMPRYEDIFQISEAKLNWMMGNRNPTGILSLKLSPSREISYLSIDSNQLDKIKQVYFLNKSFNVGFNITKIAPPFEEIDTINVELLTHL